MDQQLSRPVRWRNAVHHANQALSDLWGLNLQWTYKLEEFLEELNTLRDQRSGKCKVLSEALSELMDLQHEYDNWNVPERLFNSKLQEKLYDVHGFDFKDAYDSISDLDKFVLEDALEDTVVAASDGGFQHALERIGCELESAEKADLPKGYGRD